MTDALTLSPQDPSPDSPGAQAEAARYALLRRLAPSMRHHLVVHLQPIGMIYEVMDRRLRGPEPNLAQVHESAGKINGFARAALESSLDMVTWLAPEEGATITAQEGVRECLGLLTTSLGFRGYAVRDETGVQPRRVRRSAVRHVLTAAMLLLSDELPPPGELALIARNDATGMELLLELLPMAGEHSIQAEPGYRALAWSDLQALAATESVTLARPEPRSIRLLFPWAD
ncbi:MAG: hypothetical protein EOO25_07195 [Comamonadaceae bacterium]|nr:MAG: hypothetical protein EOO25_07195 [Comamonadaceae bacterium]